MKRLIDLSISFFSVYGGPFHGYGLYILRVSAILNKSVTQKSYYLFSINFKANRDHLGGEYFNIHLGIFGGFWRVYSSPLVESTQVECDNCGDAVDKKKATIVDGRSFCDMDCADESISLN